MLKSLSLENFKRFQKVAVDLAPFTVLMGENGSGKTSLLQAIALGLRIFSSTDMVRYDAAAKKVRIRDRGVPYTQLPGLSVEDTSDVYYAKTPRGGGGGGVNPLKIGLTDNAGSVFKVEIQSLFGAYNAKCTSTANDFKGPPDLISQQPVFISGFVGIPTSEERFFPLALADRLIRGRASDILRNLLLDTFEADQKRFERLRTMIKTNFDFELGTVSFAPAKDLTVHAAYQEVVGKRTLRLDLSTAGSGFLQILQMLTPIYRYADSARVVLLDEPDAHLHPNLQRTIARVLQEIAAEEKLQIILSTHSTAIIREVDPSAVVPVTNTKARLKPLTSPEQLESEIALRLDNFTVGKISISGRVLFVEDTDSQLLERIDGVVGVGLFEGPGAVPVLSASGKDDKVPFRIREALKEVLNTDVEVFFIRDGDGLPPNWRQKLIDYAAAHNVHLMLLARHEVESYLIEPGVISRVLADAGVVLTPDEIATRLTSIMQDVISKTRFQFERTLRDNLYKTGRLLKEEFDWGDAEKAAEQIRGQYESLTNFADLRAIAPGKETLKEFLRWVKTTHGVQLTDSQLLKALTPADVDAELAGQLAAVRS
ncbi:MAG TPA: AAA family ATPase [Gemmatimonadaceae bacterium]|jgi:predicted ATPase|nr:AAA family ATPase [Gemmatimonadaceae bacterium]